uniref:Huntingtin-interacting protein K n=1 Tax=Piliocolobus tephrosceles TaxID=591936 RepID=A0A8C9GX68_9PRIM
MRRRGEIDMATEGDVELELETETSGPERPPEKPRKHDSGAADLERVTDYAEEKEIQSSNLETGERTGKSHYQEGRSGADNDRDGDISSSSRTQLAGTHGQRGRGAYCPNQLMRASTNKPTGLIYGNKNFFVFFSLIILGQVEYILYIFYFVGNLYVGE